MNYVAAIKNSLFISSLTHFYIQPFYPVRWRENRVLTHKCQPPKIARFSRWITKFLQWVWDRDHLDKISRTLKVKLISTTYGNHRNDKWNFYGPFRQDIFVGILTFSAPAGSSFGKKWVVLYVWHIFRNLVN